jgi:hypothetical protein
MDAYGGRKIIKWYTRETGHTEIETGVHFSKITNNHTHYYRLNGTNFKMTLLKMFGLR